MGCRVAPRGYDTLWHVELQAGRDEGLQAPESMMVWQGPSMAHTSKAMIQDTSWDAATPSTIREDYNVHISRNITHTSDSMEEPRKRSSCGSRVVSWWPGQMKATIAASTQPDHSGGSSVHPGPTTSVDKSWNMCSVHPFQITSQPASALPQPRGIWAINFTSLSVS